MNPYPPETLSNFTYYLLVLGNLSCFMMVVYLNNLILVPKLLIRKKYLLYFALAILLAYASALSYTFLLKYEHVHFKQLEIFKVSIVSSPITENLSFMATYREMNSVHAVMMAFIIGFTGMWYINAYAQREKLMKEIVQKQRETELNFLKNQINPHFLFNTLNNLYGLTLVKSDVAPTSILQLSSVLRYMLYESNVPLIAFEKEKDMIQSFIDIEMLRLNESNSITFTIMNDRQAEIPPLLWLPVLENVFKHCAVHEDGEIYIDFRFIINSGKLIIYSMNSFKNDTKDNQLGYGGIGLDNLSKRLELLYPGKFSIEKRKDPGFYTVSIQINIL